MLKIVRHGTETRKQRRESKEKKKGIIGKQLLEKKMKVREGGKIKFHNEMWDSDDDVLLQAISAATQ